MLDIAWQELLLIGVVALIVIGPKDLPKALFNIGKWVRKLRHMSRDLQNNFDELMREAELSEIREQADKVRRMNIGSEIEKHIDPSGNLRKDFQAPLDSEMLGDLTDIRANPPPASPPPEPAVAAEPLPDALPPPQRPAPEKVEAATPPPLPAEKVS